MQETIFYFNLDAFTSSWSILDHKFVLSGGGHSELSEVMNDLMVQLFQRYLKNMREYNPVLCLLGNGLVKTIVSVHDQYDYAFNQAFNPKRYDEQKRYVYGCSYRSGILPNCSEISKLNQAYYIVFLPRDETISINIDIPESASIKSRIVDSDNVGTDILEYLLANLDLRKQNKRFLRALETTKSSPNSSKIASFKSVEAPEGLKWIDIQCYMNETLNSLTITIFNRNKDLENYTVEVRTKANSKGQKGSLKSRPLKFTASAITVLSSDDIITNENIDHFSFDQISEFVLLDSKNVVAYSGKINTINCKEFTSVGYGCLLESKKEAIPEDCKDETSKSGEILDFKEAPKTEADGSISEPKKSIDAS